MIIADLNNCVIILQQSGIFATPCMYDLHFMCAVFTTKPIKSILLLGLAKEIIIINLRFRPRY